MHEVYDELRSALHTIWNRRWIALATAWGVCILGWLLVASIPNKYESKARIYVSGNSALTRQMGVTSDSKAAIARVRQTLTSAVNLEKVVRETELGSRIATQQEMQGAINGLGRNVKIRSMEDNLFEISASVGRGDLTEAQNANLAQEVVAKLLDIFRQSNVQGERTETAQTLVFLDQAQRCQTP